MRRLALAATLVVVASRRPDVPQDFATTFSLRNACITFFEDQHTAFRSAFLSRHDDELMVHGFSEYVNGYQRLTTVRAATADDASLLATCARRPLAIAVPFSCNNIYHQSFHAVPAWEAWRAHAAAAAAAGAEPDLLPLVYPSAAIGHKMSRDPRKWHAWEFSVRPFTAVPSADLAARTAALLHAPCTCYDEVHGNAAAFNPLARKSAARLRAFRDASLRVLPRAPAAPTPAPILWAARQHALRNIENDAALAAAIAADGELGARVRRVVLERLPLESQMRLLSTSGGLLAVHGQAMAWVLFLPSASARTSAVEVFPRGLTNFIYRELSQTLGVRYESLTALTAGGCGGRRGAAKPKPLLSCNISVSVDAVLGAARRAAAWARAPPG